MIGALGGMMGGGGMSASSSASSSASQRASNSISTGEISVGGLTMAAKSGGIDSDVIMQGGVITGLVIGSIWLLKKVKNA